MTEQALTREQQKDIESLHSQLLFHLGRTNVDLQSIGKRLRESQPRVERKISDTESEVELAIDVAKLVLTLQQLPDAAGTDAFITAYNAHA